MDVVSAGGRCSRASLSFQTTGVRVSEVEQAAVASGIRGVGLLLVLAAGVSIVDSHGEEGGAGVLDWQKEGSK